MVAVMSSLPAVAVGGDTELTIGVVGCVGTGEGRETVPDLSHAIAASETKTTAVRPSISPSFDP